MGANAYLSPVSNKYFLNEHLIQEILNIYDLDKFYPLKYMNKQS